MTIIIIIITIQTIVAKRTLPVFFFSRTRLCASEFSQVALYSLVCAFGRAIRCFRKLRHRRRLS